MEKNLKEQLQEIKELHESNELTTEEYQQLRQRILAGKQEPQQHSEPKGTLIGLDKNMEVGPVHARFILLEELGRGGMASVWKAKDLNESKRYGKEITKALKFLHPDFAHSKAHYKRLQREADNAKKLRHPNIVAVYSFEQGPDGFLFLVMDYLKGRDLEEVLVDEGLGKGLTWQRTQALMTPVAEALRYAHKEHGIIHRDIKPGNLFLTDDNKIKVLDFGLAEQLKLSGSQLGMQVDDSRSGTKHYWAPEICNSGKLATTRDVYAFTAVVYELLTEQPPYPEKVVCDRPDDLMPQKPENISDAIWKKLIKGLSYHIEQRPDNIQAFWQKVINTQQQPLKPTLIKKKQQKKASLKKYSQKDNTDSDAAKKPMPWFFGLVLLLGLALLLGIAIVIVTALMTKDETTTPDINTDTQEKHTETIATMPASDSEKSNVIDVPLDTREENQQESVQQASRLDIEPNMVNIPAGTFTMGCVAGRDDGIGSGCDDDEKPSHKVNISAFKLATHELSNAEYVTFLNQKGRSPDKENKPWLETQSEDEDSHIIQKGKQFTVEAGFEEHPVIEVSWYGAKAYADWLNNEIKKVTGTKGNYRLPSEAEWEYAARAGGESVYSWGNKKPSCSKTVKNGASHNGGESSDCYYKIGDKYRGAERVGSYQKNAFELYDMHGNVWEWVQDRWHSNYTDNPPVDGTSWESGDSPRRVIRGGSWSFTPWDLRSASRGRNAPDYRSSDLGFRLAAGQE